MTFEYSLVKGVNDQPEDIREFDGNLETQKLSFKCHTGQSDQGREISRSQTAKMRRNSKINLKKTE